RVYRPDRHDFDVELGPVFGNFLLADEINRAPAKVQSALLEVMQERQVTIGKQTFPVPDPFLVLATQNPIESEGTYALPEAQIDRFMLKVLVDYPSHDEELTVVSRSLEQTPQLQQVLSIEDLRGLQQQARQVFVDPALISWTVDIATATRRPQDHHLSQFVDYISFGASPRGPISLVSAARALALIRGRDYVVPADMLELVRDAFRHRLVLSYRALAEELPPDTILDAVVACVPMPQLDLHRAVS
ncbi:MAG TPA: MoxR family ATPase, partial [Gaiellaceae bacterium]|nr:MoxR family ATPase [Gaiellaceae bacterium]